MPSKNRPYIGVIGAGSCSEEEAKIAEAVGKLIAESGGVLICGGLGGVMKAAAKGAREAGGTTIGILPGDNKDDANEFIEYPIATDIGEARNLVIIKSADAVIALPGKFGTLSEMAFAMKVGKPLVSLSNWNISDEIEIFNEPSAAVKRVFELLRAK
jgi:uncharacterized protein (TIGR00725 family)